MEIEIKDNNYINIQGWMLNKLKLGGEQLLIYAIIYGFSQDGKSRCLANTKYFMQWCDVKSRKTIDSFLNELIDKKYIIRETIKNDKGIHNEYYVNLSILENFNVDIKNNKDVDFSNNTAINNDTEKDKSLLKVKNEKIANKIIQQFNFQPAVEDLLYDYLFSLEQIKKFPSELSLKSQLGKLDLLNDKPEVQLEIIQKTLDRNWGSITFAFDEYLGKNNLTFDQLCQDNYYRIQFKTVSDTAIKNYPKELIENYLKDPNMPQDIKNRIISLTSQNNSINNYENKSY